MCVGTSVKIIIFSSRIGDISFTKEVILNLLSNDKIVSANAIMRCGNLLAGMIVIPNVPFQYQLTGYDTKGNHFSKTKDIVLSSQTKVKMCDLPIPTSSVLSIPAVSSVSTSAVASSVTDYMHTNTLMISATPTLIPTASPSEPTFHCPCYNGGRCVIIVRFGRTRVLCSCPKGYSGSLCQLSKLT